jgi:hypothetical protein
MSFEDILNDITEKPKVLLCTEGVVLRPLESEKMGRENLTIY